MRRIATAVLLSLAAVACAQAQPDAGSKPRLLLITGLPLVGGERFAIDAMGSPALTRLERDFEVRAVAISDRASLAGGDLLLMAQPRAQPAEALVDLDAWVRAGGRVAILADPRLDWPSERPLGDALRPPFEFADSGLLGHWGLTLDAPGSTGPARRQLSGGDVMASSPGTLRRSGAGPCEILDEGFVARCKIGKGMVLVVADADFVREEGDGLDRLVNALIDLAQTR